MKKLLPILLVVLCLVSLSGYVLFNRIDSGPPDVHSASQSHQKTSVRPVSPAKEGDSACLDEIDYHQWLKRDFSPERQLFADIRKSLVDGSELQINQQLNIPIDPKCAVICLTLFEPGRDALRWITHRDSLAASLNRAIETLRTKTSFGQFDVADSKKCRLMLEVITSEHKVNILNVATNRLDDQRFEPGVTGLKIRYNGSSQYLMPTDCAVYSYLTLDHALNHLSKRVGVSKKTNKISERAVLMKSLDADYWIMHSVAFVTWGDDILPLYRGYPVPLDFSLKKMRDMVDGSVGWAYRNMTPDGKFLYYYDGVADTVIDHTHPTRTLEDNYYNILRHSGGIITLLRMYELTKDDKYLVASDKALAFLTKQIREHTFQGRKAYYVFYNDKAKLGGTGVALTAFMRYRQLSKSTKYDPYIYGLANHLLSRIEPDGEMVGYYIHPSFNNGKPILNPSTQEKKQLFSFYYPGEAMLGLALFEQQMDMPDDYRALVKQLSTKALDFLMEIRPARYADLFEPLPSDGWLMQAIEQWYDSPEFRKKSYVDFVFNDASQMISHMYNAHDALCYDYPGAFYYKYGDHAYIDGARAEGMFAAYKLAKKIGDNEKARMILSNCMVVAENIAYTYNSPQSTYMYKHPEKSVGSFRFKFTRHWVRIDTVQHAACFYIRMLQAAAEGDL